MNLTNEDYISCLQQKNIVLFQMY